MIAKGQITVTNLDDGKTPFLHQAYKMKDGRFLKHYPVYEASPVNGYKEGDLWHRTDGSQPGYFVANKSNTTLNLSDWTFYANELAYSDTDKFYPKFEGTYSDYNEVASDDQTKYTWKIIKADDGIGIKSVKEYYAISTSNVTPPSLASDWSETPKTTNTTNKYLWNYEVYTYSNGDVKETTKRVIGTHGTTGATGASGQSVTSITEEYYLSTSKTSQTGGSWKTTPDTWTSGKYQWTRSKIVYANPTKTGYTDPVIDTSWEAIDGIQVGGRNLLPDTDRVFTNTPSPGNSVEFIALPYNLTPIFEENGIDSEYTISFDLKSYDTANTNIISVYPYPATNQINTYIFPYVSFTVTEEYKRYSMTFIPQKGDLTKDLTRMVFYGTYKTGNIPFIRRVKVEKGSKATDWTPALEDTQQAIDSKVTETDVEYYLSTSSTTPTGGTWATTAPPWVDGKFMWSRTKIVYGNGTTRYAPSATGTCIAGATGNTGNGITSVTNRYLATTLATGVTTATSGWTTTVQATDSVKKYLWNYEEILYTNGTKIPTTPVIIGTHGEKGDNSVTGLLTNESITLPANKDGLVSASSFTGATGIFDVYDGITKKTGSGVTYSLVSQSNITVSINATTGAYSVTAMPTGTTILNGFATLSAIYNGVTIEKQLSVSKSLTGATGATGPQGATGATGSRGPTGATGTSVSSVTEYYLATSESSGIVSTDTRFTTAIQTMTATNKYLWNYEKINFSDGTSQPTIPVIIGVYGDKGQTGSTGATGRSITSITEHYLATSANSGVTRSTSGWSTTMQPTTETNKYLWNYETVNWSSGTTPTYVEPIIIGVHGGKGDAGVSSYTWIRYSPNADGSSMTPTPAANSLYIGVAITSTNSAPTAYTAYTWALIKGADGKGVKSAAITYQASTSGTTVPTGSWVTTIPTVPKGQYLWTRVVTTYTDNSTSTSYSASYQGVDGVTNVTGLLTNESVTLPANVGGTVTSYTGATGTFEVFEGLTKKTHPDVEYSVLSKTNIEVTIATTGVYTITSMTSGTTVLNGFATLRAKYNGVTIDKQISVTKAVTGATGATGGTGATGASATSYWITASNNIIGKSQTGVINPTTITFKGFSKTGTANSVAYSGRFIIQTSINGTAYTTRYTSSANQNTYTYTIPSDSLFVKCLFYMAGGTTVLLDEQTVPIVESAEGIQVGGENLILNSSKLFLDQLAGGANKEFGWISLGQSYINVPAGTDIVISFDLEMVVNTANPTLQIYNTNYPGPKTFASKTLSFTKPVGSIIKERVFIKTQIIDKGSPTRTDNFIEFYSNYGTSNFFKITKLKMERGTVATDWTPAPEDARTYKAWANSSDGTADFTRVYPNDNLISKADITTGGYLTSTGAFSANTEWFHTDYIPVAGMTKLVTSGYTNLGSSPATVYYNSAKAFVKGINNNGQSLAKNITIDSGIEYIRFSGETKDLPTLKLEQGTTPTIYTTNPADSLTGSVPKYIGFSPLDSNKPSDYEWIINPEWAERKSQEETEFVREWASSEITQTSESIMQDVRSTYVQNTALENYQKDISTQFEQTSTDFNFNFNEIIKNVNRVEGDSQAKFEEISKYIRFSNGNIILGSVDSDSTLEISMNEMAFMQGGSKVAYFSKQSFYIDKGILVESLQVGGHSLVKGADGHTSFKYIG